MTSTYVLSNQTPQAAAHHQYLSQILDPVTIRRVRSLRPDLADLCCLEVGAGGGEFARWLAGQVGPDGRVLATDLHPMRIPATPRLEVRPPHDITTDPLPKEPYDLIHARLVLQHLPARRAVLRTLAKALVPGGLLLVEDWDMTWRHGRVLRAPYEADRLLWESFHDCLTDVFTTEGKVDASWASQAPDAMTDAGLVDVHAEFHSRSWRGGEPGCMLVAGTTVQLQEQLLRHGMTPEKLDRVRDLMTNPQVMIRMPPLVSTAGRRP